MTIKGCFAKRPSLTSARRKGDTTVSPFLFTMCKKLLSILFVVLIFGSALADEKKTDIAIGNSPTSGPADAPITFIEFIDFQ